MFITNSFKFMATVFTIDGYNQMDPIFCLDNYICVLFAGFFLPKSLIFKCHTHIWICKFSLNLRFKQIPNFIHYSYVDFFIFIKFKLNRIKITSSNIVGKTWQGISIFFYNFIYLDIKFPKSRALECFFSVSHSL